MAGDRTDPELPHAEAVGDDQGLVVLYDPVGIGSSNPQLARVISGVTVLGMDAQEQIVWLRGVHPDELALNFDDGYRLIPELRDGGVLFSEGALAALAALDQQLESMSGSHNLDLWTIEAIRHDPEWERVRDLAQRALPLLPENDQ